jgi:hypothetical protein
VLQKKMKKAKKERKNRAVGTGTPSPPDLSRPFLKYPFANSAWGQTPALRDFRINPLYAFRTGTFFLHYDRGKQTFLRLSWRVAGSPPRLFVVFDFREPLKTSVFRGFLTP